MPTEKTRTTHVRRIKNEDNEEIWIDVDRVDKLVSSEGQGPGYKKTTRKMFWADEENDAAHPTRTLTEKRIENPEDEDTFVNLNVIEKKRTRRGQGPGYLKSTKKYINDPERNTARQVSIRRVYHWDTETDPSEDGGTQYVRIEDTEDRSQYLDVAVIEKLISTQGQGPGFKKRTFKFNTGPIKEFSEPSPSDVDMTKVVHLDPWQNIINVQWGHPFLALGHALAGGGLAISSDGINWESVPYDGPAAFVGAYGNGTFVIAGSSAVHVSKNGKTWTGVPIHPFSNVYMLDMVFGNGKFFAVGFNLTTQSVTVAGVSEDGIEWVSSAVPTTFGILGAGFSAGKFIVFGTQSFTQVYREIVLYDFGTVFESVMQMQLSALAGVFNTPGITYGSPSVNTRFEDRLSSSLDGISWSAPTRAFESVTGEFDNSQTLVNPFTGESVTIPRVIPDVGLTPSTAIQYMASYGDPAGPMLLGRITNVPGMSLAVSPDGTGWSLVGPNIRDLFGGLGWGDNAFVACGGEGDEFGYLRSTPSGQSWTHSTAGIDTIGIFPGPPAFGKKIFVNCNASGDIFTSENGLSWTQRVHPLGAAVRIVY